MRTETLLQLPNGVMASSFALSPITYNYIVTGGTAVTYVKGYGIPSYGYILGNYRMGSATVGEPSVPNVQSGN